MKICSKCKLEKEELEFSKSKKSKDGLQFWCKDCRREYQKEYRETEKYKERHKEYQKKYAKTNKGKEYYRAYKKTNKYKEQQKEYRNTEKWKEHRKEYRNTDKYKEYHNEYQKEYIKKRKLIDPKFKLDCNMTRAICTALRGKKAGRQWESLVGYSVEDLMKHLESQFESWMNWDNWGIGKGKWNIDHRRPKSLFNYTSAEDEEFKECWALENLQPLEAIENIRKSNNYIKI